MDTIVKPIGKPSQMSEFFIFLQGGIDWNLKTMRAQYLDQACVHKQKAHIHFSLNTLLPSVYVGR